ncbi:terpene synthase family protein [Herbidospora mongoliensis]|uniref:terpene synthase family protein n=1 Tax=Herbidospora mongoliensis TaxID=688067 RepID=UPI000835C602|nr:terpene synthase family protein [Herbidospora mongoliensis]
MYAETLRVGRVLTLEEYLRLRDITGAVWLEHDLLERVTTGEMPPEILKLRPMRRMRLTTCRVVSITQDVQSLAKEEAAGDRNNILPVVEHELSLTRDQTLLYVHHDVRR